MKTTLKYVYNGLFSYFPFPASVQMRFEVKDERELEVSAEVVNDGDKPMPIGFGWHPYFSLGAKTDSLLLQLPAVKRKVMDERALPTGEEEPYDAFSSFAPIGEVFLDDCFRLTESSERASVYLWSEEKQLGLEIWQDAEIGQYQYLQVFTHPQRDRIAVEPMTCNVNAFQNQEGLRVLQPGERFCANFGVRLFTSKDAL